MASGPKTTSNDGDVEAMLAAVPDERRRADALAVHALIAEVTGAPPVLWSPSIVGFGEHRYANSAGKPVDWFEIGYSPRKAQLVLYSMAAFASFGEILARLGPHGLGKGCLYLKRVDRVDAAVLRELLAAVVAQLRAGTTA